MKFLKLYLVGYFVLLVGAGLALWQAGVLDDIPGIWLTIGIVIAVGLGIMLAVARGAGETAPLLLTAFGTPYLVTAIVGEPQTALPLLIFEGARLPFEAAQARVWAGSLELIALVLVLTFVARWFARRQTVTR